MSMPSPSQFVGVVPFEHVDCIEADDDTGKFAGDRKPGFREHDLIAIGIADFG